MAALQDFGGISVEDSIVVGLTIFRKNFGDLWIRLDPIGLEARLYHAPPAERHDRALERGVGLQADNDLGLLIDVAGHVRKNAGGNLRDREHTLLPLFLEEGCELRPQVRRTFRRAAQEALVAFVRRVVLLNEFADVDVLLPRSADEATPSLSGDF